METDEINCTAVEHKKTEETSIKVENTEDGTTTMVESNPRFENLENTDGTETVSVRKSFEGDDEYTDETTCTKIEVQTSCESSCESLKSTAAAVNETKCKEEKDEKPENLTESTSMRDISPDTSEFIEFEFSPIKKAPLSSRDGSSSPDAEAVLDQLYEAAQKGDSGKMVDLIYSGKDSGSKALDTSFGDFANSEDKLAIHKKDVNQNQAIINLLKRKTPIEKEHISLVTSWENAKKRKIAPKEKVIDFTNVKNIRDLGNVPDFGNLVPVSYEQQVSVRRKNPFRTPTPPNLPPTPYPVYKPKITVKNVLNSIATAPCVQQPTLQKQAPPVRQNVEKNLIDYSVLTKALTKTLESKLQEGEDNDVKIVIFCNNKPIQSFSVRSNSKAGGKTKESTLSNNVPVLSSPPFLSTDLTDQILKMPVDTVTNIDDILSHSPTFVSKQLNQNLGLTANNVPTIGDVKAILERNRRIASECLAKYGSNRSKTKRIPDGSLDLVLKELRSKNSDSDTDSCSTLEVNTSESKKKGEIDTELEERKLVINDTVTTDENCNESLEEIKCDQCAKTFKQQRYLNRHKIRVHSSSKQAAQLAEQSTSHTDSPIEIVRSATIEDEIAVMGDTTNEISLKNERVTDDGHKLDGTVDENVSEIVTELDEVAVKSEPLSDSEDTEIQSLLSDNKFMTMLETADRNKRGLFTQDDQHHGVLAKDILNTNHKSKAYSFDYRPPVTEQGLVEPVYVCEQCGKFYRARKTLKDHFLREHAKDKDDEPLYLYITGNKYQCPICFNNYHSGSELVSHTKKHTGELRSVCKLCGKVYSSVHVLRRHIDNIHSDIKPRPFQCELCDYAASNKWHLKEHYRRHTGEQPFKCPVCVKSFSHQGTMNRHCKTIHKLEIPSQRPFARNNICDLPDLPIDGDTTTEYEEVQPDDDMKLLCSEEGVPDSPSVDNEKDIDIDMSIVKTEPEEVDVDN